MPRRVFACLVSLSLPQAILALALLCGGGVSVAAAELTAQQCDHGVVIKIDGQPFAEYWYRSGSKPIVWPIIGPGGQPLTRFYPMAEGGTNEKKDHPHHRSLWFTHGSVNGIDFWAEPAKKEPKNHPLGQIVHRELVKVAGGQEAVVITRNDWIGPEGKKVLEDHRRVGFAGDASRRWIDFDITLTAGQEPVVFGDTKEGSFGLRVAETMKVDAKLGGQIVNSQGLRNAEAWGQTASWVDYHGPVADQTGGIAILNHPSSFHYPTRWHVRTYGLFAANPFGLKDFPGAPKGADGAVKLAAGKSLTLWYRVLLHKGDEHEGQVAEMWTAYSKEPRPNPAGSQ